MKMVPVKLANLFLPTIWIILLNMLPSHLLAANTLTNSADDNKSIVKDTDWKKLWQNAGQHKNPNNLKADNNIDSTDTSMIEDNEVKAENVTVQLGTTGFLVCKVTGTDRVGLNWNQISWIRRRDWHILSSGSQTYTNDERFTVLHAPGSNVWTLQIKFVQQRDSGLYECQISTATGIMSHFVNLQVVVPEAFILGSGELHVDMGSAINLVCIIEKSPTPPQYVFWQRNDHMINYDDTRHDITIETTPGPRTHSRLIIREPQITDSGNYTCSASNTEPASIYVFVSKGDNTAAISKRKTNSAITSTSVAFNTCHSCILIKFICLIPSVVLTLLAIHS